MKYKFKAESFIAPIVGGLVAGLLTRSLSLGIALFAALIMPAVINIYIPYAKDNPKHLWFKRKLYGWGWTPVTWQGWVAIWVYVAAIVKIFLVTDQNSHSGSDTLYGIFIPVLILTALLISLCYWKGEKPRWQWGE